MAILPKGGVNIAGHKIPWEAIAAIAGVAGVILVIRARQQGSNVASVGQQPASAATSAIDPSLFGFGSTGFTSDPTAALADLSQQIAALQQTGINGSTTSVQQRTVTLQGEPGYRTNAAGQALLALWNGPGVASGEFSELPAGTQLISGGVPIAGQTYAGSSFWQPVVVGGQTKYVWAPDAPAANTSITA